SHLDDHIRGLDKEPLLFQKKYDCLNFNIFSINLNFGVITLLPKITHEQNWGVSKGHVGLKSMTRLAFFSTHKGLLQGDTLSPILFNIVVDLAMENNQFAGLRITLIFFVVGLPPYFYDETHIFGL
ncbi:hypothetical protein ACJX0J_030027, partial [Zea mays]